MITRPWFRPRDRTEPGATEIQNRRRSAVRTALIVATAAAAVMTVALVTTTVALWRGPEQNAPVTASTSDGTAPTQAAPFNFSLLDQPRPLPELHFVNGDGRPMTLADFRGRVVLLNLWATWCVPCRKEMPTLDRLQAKLGGPDFQVITLSIDRGGLPVVKQFYKELGLKSLGIYVDQSGKAASTLGAVGIPTTLLIDRQGREIGRKVGAAKWDSAEVIKVLRPYLKPRAHADRAVVNRPIMAERSLNP